MKSPLIILSLFLTLSISAQESGEISEHIDFSNPTHETSTSNGTLVSPYSKEEGYSLEKTTHTLTITLTDNITRKLVSFSYSIINNETITEKDGSLLEVYYLKLKNNELESSNAKFIYFPDGSRGFYYMYNLELNNFNSLIILIKV